MKIGWLGKKWGSRHKPVGPNYLRFGVFETGPEFLFLVQTGYFPVFRSPDSAMLYDFLRTENTVISF